MTTLAACFKRHNTPADKQSLILAKVRELTDLGEENPQLAAVLALIKDAEGHREMIVGKIEAAGMVAPEINLISGKNTDTLEGKGGKSDGKIREQVSGNNGELSQTEQSEGTQEAGVRGETDGVPGGHTGTIRGSGGNDLSTNDNGPSGEANTEDAEDQSSEVDIEGNNSQRPGRIPVQPRNYRITDADALGKGGAKSKAKANIKAIQILKKLQASGRPANAEQQSALVKYTGWGSSELANGMFPKRQYDRDKRDYVDVYKDGWQELGEKLKSLLSPKEYAEAQGSTLNAHYTSQEVISAMYRALLRFGYKGNGRILEPGSGIDSFIGLLPDSLLSSRFTSVEMDPITAGIAKLLYPGHDVRNADFADFKAPNDFFDIAIGNPPFLDVKVTGDPDYAKNNFLVHDFFFAKSIDKVRPGGLLMLVTSKGTMDKASDKARSYLSKRADLIGAVRLPQTAFKENAGTEVVTDVIFLKKRKEGEQYAGEPWSELTEIKTKDGEAAFINEYFAKNPDMVLGNHSMKGTMYGPNQYTVTPKKEPISELFDAAVKNLPENIYDMDTRPTATDADAVEAQFSPEAIKEGGFYLDGDNIFQKENGVGVPIKAFGEKQRLIKDFISLRDAVRNVLYVQMKDKDADLTESQQQLESAYDFFVERHGPINKAKLTTRALKDGSESTSTQYLNFRYFKSDPDAYLVASIEKYDLETKKAVKADIFTQRVIDPAVEPKIESLVDALHVSLGKTGGVDIKMIADSMSVTEEDAIAGLEGILFKDPNGNKWVTNDEYLSGNVRAKLEEAKKATEIDKAFSGNVKALEAVQPEDWPRERIRINLGMPVLDPEHIVDFARETINMGVKVSYLPQDGSWKVESFSGYQTAESTSDFGTNRIHAGQLLEHALNGSSPKIYDTDQDRKQVLNKVDTQAAMEKVSKIQATFREWVWAEADRAELMSRRFNDLYNNTVKREFGGDFITNMQFPGMSRVKTPFEHQKRVAWRIIQRGNTYMAHSVGAGKTIASIVAGMEMKRLGIKKKPVWTVPNHMLKQFAGEFLELYPAAKILVADEEQFAKENRNRFMGRVAAENWDAIIITHSAFQMVPMSPDFQGQFIDEQIAELDELLQEVSGDRLKRKQIERLKKRLQERLKKIMSNANKDKGVVFEETGIDQIFVDEAHEFRKLDFATNQSNIKGIDPNGSLKAFDLYVKSKYLESLYPNRSLVLMSGTPVTNTLGEIYSIQKYLQEGKLRELGLHHFDSWASTFGGMVSNIEATPAGTYKMVSRFGDLSNLQALVAMWGEIGDFVHAKDLPYLTRPKVKGGGRQLVVGETGELQREYKKELGQRIKEIEARKRPPKKGDDIILSVITDGRHAAMDDRYINPNAAEREDSKMSMLLGKSFEIWDRTKDQKSTQMIFCDLGMPGSVEKRGFSVYSHIKQELMKKGVPENEIAFMQDYKKSDQKTKLFKAMNEGKVRFLIGSSQAMGTGVNAQKKLVALHHFDPDTYLPANIEQREGRIIRQGNENNEVELYAYVARGSYDETMWQFLETKQRFIDDFLAGNSSSDTASDIDGSADSFAQARAMSSDNPLAVELAGVQNDLTRLQSLERAHYSDQSTLKRNKSYAEKEVEFAKERVEKLEDAISRRVPTKGDLFKATMEGKEFTDRKEAGEFLLSMLGKMLKDVSETAYQKLIGNIGGFDIKVSKQTPKGFEANVEVRIEDQRLTVDYFRLNEKEVTDASPSGLIMQFENAIKGLDSKLTRSRADILNAENIISGADERIGKKFEYQSMLDEKLAREKEIKAALEAEDKAANAPAKQDVEDDDGKDINPSPSLSSPGNGDNLALKDNEPVYTKGDDYEKREETLTKDQQANANRATTAAVAFVRGLPGNVLANRIAKDFQDKSKTDLIGQEVENIDDVALIGQIYRNPHFETSRLIFIKDGKVVGVTGVSSRLPSSTAIFTNDVKTVDDAILRINTLMSKSGADSFYLLHNHPSGNPSPSKQDKTVTASIAARTPNSFLGHVIINHDSYATLDKNGVQVKQLPESISKKQYVAGQSPIVDNPLLGMWLGTAADLATIAAKLQGDKSSFQIIGTSGKNSIVSGIIDVPVSSVFLKGRLKQAVMLRRFMKATGSGHLFAVNVPINTGIDFTGAIENNLLFDVQFQDGTTLLGKVQPIDGIVAGRSQEKAFVVEEEGPQVSVANETAKTPLSADALQDIATTVKQAKGSIKFIKNKKVDSTFLDRVLSTPEYYFKKFGAAGRVLQAALLRRDIRHEKETEILGGFVTYIQDLRKTNKKAYTEANDYLIETDQQVEGFRMKTTDSGKFRVSAPKWAVKLAEGEKFTKEKAVIGEFEEEQEAVKAMIDAESAALEEDGYSKEAVKAVVMARQLTNRGFDIMAADMRKIIREAKENGMPDPFVGDGKLDEAGRYGVYAAGKSKPIALFATEREASDFLDQAAQMISYMVYSQKKGSRDFMNELKAKRWADMHSGTVKKAKTFQNLSVKKRSNADMRPLTVKQAMAQMGDLRGIFFPRIREAGEYVLIAKKEGENPIRKSFDIPTVGDDKPTLQKFLAKATPIGREAEILKAKGYSVTIERDKSPSEDVFEATNLVTSLDAILTSSLEVANKNDDMEVRASQHINQILTMQVADIFKSRGYLSSRLKRLSGDVVWEGYETDMGKALTQYGKNVAAGTAKRDTARAMVLAFSGRDYTWAEYKAEVDKPSFAEYQAIVDKRRIDERTQKNLFRDVRSFMIDILRNDEQADRIIGTMKGLAVIKYMGFRVSSAAVNMTNLVLGVPATLAGHTGESIPDALGRVISAATAYGQYRTGKGSLSKEDRALFEHISAKGWDEAQFNQEAASELRGKLGDAWNKFTTASMFMFGAAEKVNRATTLFAAYKAVKAKNKTAEESVIWEQAKEISDRAHGIYGKETIPAWARGKYNVLRLTYTFQKFSHNYMLNMIDLGFNRKEYKAASYMLLAPAILAGSGATLASPVLFALAGALGIGGDDPEEEFYTWAEKTFSGGAFARQGLFGVASINIKGSLQMNMPMPADIGKAKIADLAGPVGGILTDTAKGVENILSGNLAKGIEFLLPTAFGSMSKATREATEGVTTSNYGSVFYGDEPLKADAADAFLRFLSFNPARISGIREKQWNEKEVATRYQADKSEIYASIKRLHIQGKALTPEILKEISVYNERVNNSGRNDLTVITPKGIKTMLKRNDRPSKLERMREEE